MTNIELKIGKLYQVRWMESTKSFESSPMTLRKEMKIGGKHFLYFTNSCTMVIHEARGEDYGAYCGLYGESDYKIFDAAAFKNSALYFEIFNDTKDAEPDLILLHQKTFYSRDQLDAELSNAAAPFAHHSQLTTNNITPNLQKQIQALQEKLGRPYITVPDYAYIELDLAKPISCTCGALKASGVKHFQAGHSSWCDVHESRR